MSARLVLRVKHRVGRRLGFQQGLTIIELLLSLTLLVLIVGFLAGGLQMARRAFVADGRAAATSEIDQAVDVITNQIATAFPLTDQRSGKLDFDGRRDAIAFAGLDQGHASRAGVRHALIQQVGGDLTINLTPTGSARSEHGATGNSLLLVNGVADVQFSYFGSTGQATAPAWRPSWSAMDRLPDLISVHIEFRDPAFTSVTVLVAIRQRS